MNRERHPVWAKGRQDHADSGLDGGLRNYESRIRNLLKDISRRFCCEWPFENKKISNLADTNASVCVLYTWRGFIFVGSKIMTTCPISAISVGYRNNWIVQCLAKVLRGLGYVELSIFLFSTSRKCRFIKSKSSRPNILTELYFLV